MADSIILTKKKRVAGNYKDAEQVYYIKFYPRLIDMPEKIAIYTHLEKGGIPIMSKSTYFSSKEQLKTFAKDVLEAYFFFWEKKLGDTRLSPFLPELRITELNSVLKDLKENQIRKWRERK